ncbi:unnamed protein product, partial [Ascophyllum nodosum]
MFTYSSVFLFALVFAGRDGGFPLSSSLRPSQMMASASDVVPDEKEVKKTGGSMFESLEKFGHDVMAPFTGGKKDSTKAAEAASDTKDAASKNAKSASKTAKDSAKDAKDSVEEATGQKKSVTEKISDFVTGHGQDAKNAASETATDAKDT